MRSTDALGRTPLGAGQAHAIALLLGGRCPRCAERLPAGAALRGAACPRCGAPTAPDPADRAALAERLAGRAGRRMWIAVALAAGATLVVGWAPLAASLLLAAGLLWVGATIARPAARLLSPPRRLVSTWTLRLAGAAWFAALVVVTEALTLVPIASAPAKSVLVALQIGFAASLARRYLSAQARREAAGLPVRLREWALLGGSAAALVAGVVAATRALAWLVAQLDAIGRWVG